MPFIRKTKGYFNISVILGMFLESSVVCGEIFWCFFELLCVFVLGFVFVSVVVLDVV
jgi:hypothetical protein